MKKILITGGSGFIGTNLINTLLKKTNLLIVNIDKLSKFSTPEKYKIKSKNYKFYKFNLSNKYKLSKVLKKNFDFIIHLAAESHVDRSIESPKKFFMENIKSSFSLYENIAVMVNKKKIKSPKIIHISTDEIYGSILNKCCDENYKTYTSSPYSASKASSENIAQSFINTFNLSISILRITNNFGPYQNPEKFIPKIIKNVMNKKKIILYSKGLNVREWIFVEDTCEAIYKFLYKYKKNKIYNIGSEKRYNNLEIIKIILKFMNVKFDNKLIKSVKDRPGHDFRYALNSQKFKKEFNWNCKFSTKDGIKKTVEWYYDNKEWIRYFK